MVSPYNKQGSPEGVNDETGTMKGSGERLPCVRSYVPAGRPATGVATG